MSERMDNGIPQEYQNFQAPPEKPNKNSEIPLTPEQVRINGMRPHLDLMKTLRENGRGDDAFDPLISDTEKIISEVEENNSAYTVQELEEHLVKVARATEEFVLKGERLDRKNQEIKEQIDRIKKAEQEVEQRNAQNPQKETE